MTRPPSGEHERARRGGGLAAPFVVVGQQQNAGAERLDRILDRGLGEVRAVAVPDELDTTAVLARFARRRRVGVEVDDALLVGHLGDGVGDARMDRADQVGAVLLGDEALGDAAAGFRLRLGVGRDPLDAAAEHATPRVDLLQGEADAAQIVLAARGVLAARVAGQPDPDRLVLGKRGVVAPGPVERGRQGRLRPRRCG